MSRKLSDYDFALPDERIATRPAVPRSAARMLVVDGQGFHDRGVTDLPDWLRPGDRLILNDTRVIPARLVGERIRPTADGSGRARVEVNLTEPLADGTWAGLARPMRKMRPGDALRFGDLHATVASKDAERIVLRFDTSGEALDRALEAAGTMPLPPYIAAKRAPDERDRDDYQTVWAERKGAVAAPTASLHFDPPLLDAIARRGVDVTKVTLHVGAGTFLPVKVDDVTDHRMHAEWGEVTERAAAEIAATKAAGGRVIPVGTTALRVIETAARTGAVAPFRGETDIFITPGFEFRATDGLMTNFHLPRSTLLMLVSALMGRDRMLAAYDHAIRGGYRFFSYGDASLLLP
ncbi:tRNA preQ1(34) S-adenosylmethionine ribosyltransferase-isomerase QueA [Jannaschia sp. LMIT008]|uniref:tRNA preQ1(34) S-adenosylmethionine ribosyltransferase-isomerase QueA n=1 Tax=Jannaschia maritima TaxID=3032585 RepID=UPI00281136A2|nr:tRNA preQ1(34) S-adenosylmethionine ribosyltransferase-isomerase QueA [Jannaschia sp. LMIT008]